MFVVTLSKTSLKKLGLGAMCCALVVCSALLGADAGDGAAGGDEKQTLLCGHK